MTADSECIVDADGHAGVAAERVQPTTCGVNGLARDVQDNDDEEPPPSSGSDSKCAHDAPRSVGLTPPSSTKPYEIRSDDDGPDCTVPDDDELTIKKRDSEAEVPEEAAENTVNETVEGCDAMTAPECPSDEVEGLLDLPRDTPDEGEGLSSPDSDHAPLTPPGLPSPRRRVFFGSVSPEYLKTMWEEEGPAAWADTGVWAAKVRATPFIYALTWGAQTSVA